MTKVLTQSELAIDPITVIIVDDDRDILSALSIYLPNCGYEVECFDNPADALVAAKSRVFDVLLCDMVMPQISGLGMLEELRGCNPDMTIIMWSAYPDCASTVRAVELGARDFMVKPFPLKAVPIAIERNLASKRLDALREARRYSGILMQTIRALSCAMSVREDYTAEHSRRMASLAFSVAEVMGLSVSERHTLELATCMHDIGKIGVSKAVLGKTTELSDEEQKEIRSHPDIGYKILSRVDDLSELAVIIRHHHERVDGKGYPDGLVGEEIPLLSRILTVVDAYDSMTTDKPYRKGLGHEQAIQKLKASSGTQFDPQIVDALIKSLEAGELASA